jgi:phytanoyl-CoA hydroxylase
MIKENWLLPAGSPVSEVADTYKRLGFVGVANLITPDEVAELDAAHKDALRTGAMIDSDTEMADNYDTIYRHKTFEPYVRDPRITSIVQAILDTGVELQHVKFNAKPPGGGHVAWHQDFAFYPHTNYDLIAATIYLDPAGEGNGALRFIPGSHAWGELAHHDAEGNFAYGCADQNSLSQKPAVTLAVPAGTVTFHHCLTVHTSSAATNGQPRRLLIFQFRADDAAQLAGAIWDCTGIPITAENPVRRARFPDGTTINLRGRDGRLIDIFGNLRPAKPLVSVKPR